MQKFISKSEKETEEIAAAFARSLKKGSVVAFEGGLGAGKTAFVRGLAKGLNCEDSVSSPTFAIVNEYNGETRLFHFDMYRIETFNELYSIGFFEYLEKNGVCAIEWSENIYSALPDDSFFVKISKISETEREIEIWEGKE